MSKIIDAACIALLLAASVAYVLYSLGPKGLRRRMLAALAHVAAAAPASLRLGNIAHRLNAAADKAAAACGGCGSCESGSSVGEKAAPEVRVPLSRIGRRR